MKDTDYIGKDKLYHFLVCFIASIVSPCFALGLALGKEYGDKKAYGNHWCWWDLCADGLGIIIGTVIRTIILYNAGFTQFIYM